ncbi:MAG: DNA methylase [Proteobacteria bacterium SG_bin6]|nr:MAG: DNA methylase [Proteobacteria bacterium SG_bin6]
MPIGRTNPHARRLRRDATDVEQRFWLAVRDRRLGGFKFRRQVTIGPFVADFACIERRLIVELDGGQHDQEADAARTAYLEGLGWRVRRFWNNEVVENFEGVLQVVLAELNRSP